MTLISTAQLSVSSKVIEPNYNRPKIESNSKTDNNSKSDFINYNKNNFWFVITSGKLCWYKDESMETRKGIINIKGTYFKPTDEENTLIIVAKKQ